MTENEAREAIKLEGSLEIKGSPERLVAFFEGLEVADIVLEKVQQYPKLGTPEELKETTKYLQLAKKHGTVGKAIEACAEYEGIGTVEECRAAVEKQIRKPAKNPYGTSYIWKAGYCPVCGCGVTARWDYCQCCGQKLKWGD